MAAGWTNFLALLWGWKAAHRPPLLPCYTAAAAIFVAGAEAAQCWAD
jgi:hypothetical protein